MEALGVVGVKPDGATQVHRSDLENAIANAVAATIWFRAYLRSFQSTATHLITAERNMNYSTAFSETPDPGSQLSDLTDGADAMILVNTQRMRLQFNVTLVRTCIIPDRMWCYSLTRMTIAHNWVGNLMHAFRPGLCTCPAS